MNIKEKKRLKLSHVYYVLIIINLGLFFLLAYQSNQSYKNYMENKDYYVVNTIDDGIKVYECKEEL